MSCKILKNMIRYIMPIREEIMKQVSFKEAMQYWSKPERIILVTSCDADGTPYVMTAGWKMRASFKPPMLAIAVGKNRTTHQNISASKEFVVAVPGADLAGEALDCGMPSTNDQDRFELCGFSKKPGSFVKAPLIEKCIASFECRLAGQVDSGDHTVFVGEVRAAWLNEKPAQPLLIVGEESGYEVLATEGPYRLGVVSSK